MSRTYKSSGSTRNTVMSPCGPSCHILRIPLASRLEWCDALLERPASVKADKRVPLDPSPNTERGESIENSVTVMLGKPLAAHYTDRFVRTEKQPEATEEM
jgi:hypothetical protein